MQTRSLSRRSAVIAASALALAAVWSTPVAVQAQQKSVKIAIIVPLSGPWARQGTLVIYGR
jgi:ABC-type sugar transport system substrate-binding protein